VVGVTATPSGGVIPLMVLFNFTASTDEENNIVRCEVDKDGNGTIDASSETGRLVMVEYTDPADYHPKARVVDACGATSETTLLVTAHLNNPPVANSATVTTALNNATAVELTGYDMDGDALSFTVTAPPTHGALTGTGAVRIYTPAVDFIGEDSFEFVANDGRTNSTRADVTIKVTTAVQKMRIPFAGYTRGEALTNFPLLVVFNPELLTNGFSYNKFASSDGYDLRFTDESGKTNFNYEVETWNTNGASFVWVQIPVLTNGGSMWAWWGDKDLAAVPPACATNGATWDAKYKGVWHLGERSGNALDSTVARNSGTVVANVGRTVGKVAGGAGFDGSNGEFAVNSTFDLGASSVTLEAMAYVEAGKHGAFLKVGDNSSGFGIGIGGGYFEEVGQNYRLLYEGVRWIQPSTTVTTGWHHFAMVISSDGVPTAVIDGTPIGSFAGLNAIAPIGSIAHIGGYLNTNMGLLQRHYNGLLDEIRISSVPRSTNWLWACWRNVSSNADFNPCGAIMPGGKDTYGVPDDWKIRHFGGTGMPGADSMDDCDHDGMNNLCEYLAGTNPTNAASRLEIQSSVQAADGTNFLFRWSSVSGKRYSVDAGTNLMEGFPIHAATNILATPEVNIWTIRVDHAAQKFFRVHVEP